MKQCDQACKQTDGKMDITLVPLQILFDVEKVRKWSISTKYHDKESWKQVPVVEYYKALFRHFAAVLRGEYLDSESGLPHYYHLACNIAFICWLEDKERM